MIEDYQVKAALKAFDDHGGSVGAMRAALEAAANAKPPQKVVVTDEMERVGLAAYYKSAPQNYVNRYCAHDSMADAYRAMHALAPLPEVTDGAVTVAYDDWNKSSFKDKAAFKYAIRAALPIILGRK